MSTTSEEPKSSNNVESLKQDALACGPGCGCHTVGPSSRSRWVVGVIVLVAAGVLVARAVVRNNDASADAATVGFASVTSDTSESLDSAAWRPSSAKASEGKDASPYPV
jgi:MYXO-CTERM domain-containing protein